MNSLGGPEQLPEKFDYSTGRRKLAQSTADGKDAHPHSTRHAARRPDPDSANQTGYPNSADTYPANPQTERSGCSYEILPENFCVHAGHFVRNIAVSQHPAAIRKAERRGKS